MINEHDYCDADARLRALVDQENERELMIELAESGAVFVSRGRLLVRSLFDATVQSSPLALHPSGDVWIYENGRYVFDRHGLAYLVAERLGDHFKPDHVRNFVAYAAARLSNSGRVLSMTESSRWVNLANGMLDPLTGELEPHDPDHLSVVQLAVAFDPAANCPTFDSWLSEVLPEPGARDALIEDLGMLLDLRGMRQKKALFLSGPPRSGKSTLARIVEAMVGPENSSAEELTDLASNRFRAAELFGKMLNVASDITAGHVADVTLFKRLTGEDTISAERKFGHPFVFRFHGLFVFTMNDIPSVEDTTRAYFARVRPYRFPRSFVGRENPEIEAQMMKELPGILNRLVDGLRSLEDRGQYLVNDATERARQSFEAQSDRVLLWVNEATRSDGWSKRGDLHRSFAEWARDRRRGSMSRNEFYAALRGLGYESTVRSGHHGFKLVPLDDYDHAFEAVAP